MEKMAKGQYLLHLQFLFELKYIATRAAQAKLGLNKP